MHLPCFCSMLHHRVPWKRGSNMWSTSRCRSGLAQGRWPSPITGLWTLPRSSVASLLGLTTSQDLYRHVGEHWSTIVGERLSPVATSKTSCAKRAGVGPLPRASATLTAQARSGLSPWMSMTSVVARKLEFTVAGEHDFGWKSI